MRLSSANTRSLMTPSNGGVTSMRSIVAQGERGEQGLPGDDSAWVPVDAVTTGTVRQAPDGSRIKSKASRTTGATWNDTEKAFWDTVAATDGTFEQERLTASTAGSIEPGETDPQAAVDARAALAAASVASTSRLRAPTPPTIPSVRRMVGAMSAGHGWTIAGAGVASSNLNNTSDVFLGSQSVSITSLSSSGTLATIKTGLAMDFTDCDVRVYWKYDLADALSNMEVMLGASGLADRFSRIVLNLVSTSDAAGYMHQPGDWSWVDIPWSSLAITGSPNRAAIDTIQVKFVNKAGHVVQVGFCGVASILPESPWPNGVVSITADDCYASQWTILRPMLDAYGDRMSLFPVLGSLGAGYFTLANLQALRDQGHEIGGHATSSAAHTQGLVAMTQSERRTELETIRQWGADNGFNVESFAYPLGYWSKAVAEDVQRYFSSGRLAFAPHPSLARPDHQFAYRAINAGTQQSSLATFVDQVKAAKAWLPVVVHDVVASGASGNNITTANMQAFIDYCHTQGVPIRTVGEVISRAA